MASIGHLCAGAGAGFRTSLISRPHGWNRELDGVMLSDHGGVLVELAIYLCGDGAVS